MVSLGCIFFTSLYMYIPTLRNGLVQTMFHYEGAKCLITNSGGHQLFTVVVSKKRMFHFVVVTQASRGIAISKVAKID